MYKSVAYFLALCLSLTLPGLVVATNVRDGFDATWNPVNEYESPAASWPQTDAASALVFDAESGTVLFQKNEDKVIPPASMTKLVVLSLIFQHLQDKNINVDDDIVIDPKSYATHAPPRSSLMFLGPGQRCSWKDLLLGLAVSSGNDAAVAAAINVDGSVEAFVVHMNQFVQSLGMKHTVFVEPSGYDARNVTTAREFSFLIWWYLKQFPQALEYHSTKSFSYPRPENFIRETKGNTVTQTNRNGLILSYEGAEGLKSGYIDESGYNLSFVAKRDDFRVAGVLFGAKSEHARNNDARMFLDHAFQYFRPIILESSLPPPIRVWKGSSSWIQFPKPNVHTVLPVTLLDSITTVIKIPKEIIAPLGQNISVGSITFSANGKILAHIPLTLRSGLLEGPQIATFFDEAYLKARELVGIPKPRLVLQSR